MKIRPINLKDANEFVNKHHRHHKGVTGYKFAISCIDDNSEIIGVAICGRPVSRYLDNGETIEVNRLCTLGARNACSLLYSRCCQIAKAMGYKKIITYTLLSENGSSLKASGFVCEGVAGGEIWTGKRNKDNGVPKEKK